VIASRKKRKEKDYIIPYSANNYSIYKKIKIETTIVIHLMSAFEHI
jgi:hypothetical protein